jgi:type II secretory pathway pseudopilin PulG
MVVVAIIAILAAVALPMFSTFKQKSKVGTALKACSQATSGLQAYYEDHDAGFLNISMPSANGGSFLASGVVAQVGLPQVPGMAWTVPPATADVLVITMTWDASAACPAATCNGSFCIKCSRDNNICLVGQTIGTTNSLNLNRTPTDVTGVTWGTCP